MLAGKSVIITWGVPRAGALVSHGTGACASTAPCMLYMMTGTFLLECPAMQTVRDRYPALFSPAKGSMQLFMWQPDIVGVAHFVMDCFDLLGVVPDAQDDGSSDSDSSSSALAAG